MRLAQAIFMIFGRRRLAVYRITLFLLFVIYVSFVLFTVSSIQSEDNEDAMEKEKQARRKNLERIIYELQDSQHFQHFLQNEIQKIYDAEFKTRDDRKIGELRRINEQELAKIKALESDVIEAYQLINEKQSIISKIIRKLSQEDKLKKELTFKAKNLDNGQSPDEVEKQSKGMEQTERVKSGVNIMVHEVKNYETEIEFIGPKEDENLENEHEDVLFNRKEMIQVHERIYNKLSEEELNEYYSREQKAFAMYGQKVLDVEDDREKLMALFPAPSEQRDRVTEQLYTKIKVNDYKLIYVNKYIDGVQQEFDRQTCTVDKCRFTRDNSKASQADVILSKYFSEPYNFTNPNQIRVLYQLESAGYYRRTGEKLNWTASYRRDSVINTPYERFTPYRHVTRLPQKTTRNYATGKTKMVAWMVSNCRSKGRLNYVKSLQKYVSVDIYGQCGTLKCHRKYNIRCSERLKKDYKFYLSFENTNCKDYVTEKFFQNGLQNNLVPIVMGARPEEYKQIAPPNSYIHVDEFDSPRELANYLHFLDQNDEYYNQYFRWKGTGDYINTKFLCRLCLMVHLAPHFPMWYNSSQEWWSNEGICQQPTDQNGVVYPTWRKQKSVVPVSQTYVRYGYERKEINIEEEDEAKF